MRAALRAFLADILDYAGLFPPAKLELDQAIRNYARYRCEPEAWMLARFVCPASRLGELAPYLDELLKQGPPLRLSVLGRGGETHSQFLSGLRSDLDEIATFHAMARNRSTIEAFEVRLPDEISRESQITQLVGEAANLWDERQAERVAVFYEPPTANDRETIWPTVIRSLASCDGPDRDASDPGQPSRRFGVKLRFGGLHAAAYPSLEEATTAIWSAGTSGIPMKFTAGLHQPFRHHDPELRTDMHGFLNVFTAGIVAASGSAARQDVRDILASKDVGSIKFGKDAVSFGEIRVAPDAIGKARRHAVVSFGSCSFDEPRAGLRDLGLL